jgi:hypothetical protein
VIGDDATNTLTMRAEYADRVRCPDANRVG